MKQRLLSRCFPAAIWAAATITCSSALPASGGAEAAAAQREQVPQLRGVEVSGRFVRVELPGDNRYLSLAEVEVLAGGKNLALKAKASQSSQWGGGAAGLAVDGNRNPVYTEGSVTHTELNSAPWWEVDLGRVQKIDSIKIWNRASMRERLDGCRVSILDDKRCQLAHASAAKAGATLEFVVAEMSPGSGKVIAAIPAPPPPPPMKGETIKTADLPQGLQPEAAAKLLEAGVEEILFVKRFTLNANHVYTEYVNSRWLPGGNLCALNLRTGAVRELIPEFNACVFNRFDLSFDAKKVIFDCKRTQNEGYRIFEVNVDGTGLRQLTFPVTNEKELQAKHGKPGYHYGTDDLHPCYLPDGGVMFSSTRCQYGTLCDSPSIFTTKVIHRMDGDGGNILQLSNNSVSEASPAMMSDGRVMYHRWEYVDKAAGNLKCIWAMRPDGTGSVEIYGNSISHPETLIYPRAIPGSDDKIVMLGATHWGPNNAMGTVIVVDMRKHIRSYDAMRFVTSDINAFGHDGFYFKNAEGKWYRDSTGIDGRLFKDPYPLSEHLFIAAHKPKGLKWDNAIGYDLTVIDGEGNGQVLYRDHAISCWHPYPLLARTKPPVLLSAIDEELANQREALCIVQDVHYGMEGVEPGTVKFIRVMEQVSRPWSVINDWCGSDRDGMAYTALGNNLLGLKVQYGLVPVNADGSACFKVPANKNIYFQALDKNYMAVHTERTFVNYMPGEVRGCVGCHELPNDVPTTRRTTNMALGGTGPAALQAQPGEASVGKLFDYPRQIQPILDKQCIECHAGDKPKADLALTGEAQGIYSRSYNNLIARSRKVANLLGNRALLNENAGSACIEYMPPYTIGSTTSLLLAMHAEGRFEPRDKTTAAMAKLKAKAHVSVKLSDAEFYALANWIDANCQFHPSYWGRKHEKFAGHENFRPQVKFDEAVGTEPPAWNR